MNEKIPLNLPIIVLGSGLLAAAALRAIALANAAWYPLDLVACLVIVGALVSGVFLQWFGALQAKQRNRKGFFVKIASDAADAPQDRFPNSPS
jgi:hypothetical protein